MIKNSFPDKKNHKELFDKDYNQDMERFNKLDLKIIKCYFVFAMAKLPTTLILRKLVGMRILKK